MPDSIYFLVIIIALAIMGAAWIYAGWEKFDDQRRADRQCKRNLEKMAGR